MVLATEGSPKTVFAGALGGSLRFARYLAAGAVSFTVDFSLFVALVHSLGATAPIAHLVSRPAGGLACFLINRAWTFRAAGRRSIPVQLGRFWVVFGMSFALTEGLILLLCGWLGLPAVPGKLISEGIALVFNFLVLKHWTFR